MHAKEGGRAPAPRRSIPEPCWGLAAADVVIAVFGVASALTSIRTAPTSGLLAVGERICAVLMLVTTALLLFCGLLHGLGCPRLCTVVAGASIGATMCLAISQVLTQGGLGPWLLLIEAIMLVLAICTAALSSKRRE